MTQKFQELSKLIEDKNTEFVIPNFAPYDWDIEHCGYFWDNTIKNIEDKSGVLSRNLAYENQHGGLTIIDRHSNLTTFILLCRALYEHLVSQPNIQQSCLEQLAKYVWKHDFNHRFSFLDMQLLLPISFPFLFYKNRENIEDRVQLIKRDNEILMNILKEKVDLQLQDFTCKYAKNFIFLYDKLSAYQKEKGMEWEDLCKMFLQVRRDCHLVMCDNKKHAEDLLGWAYQPFHVVTIPQSSPLLGI